MKRKTLKAARRKRHTTYIEMEEEGQQIYHQKQCKQKISQETSLK